MTGRAPRLAWISVDDPPGAFPPLANAFTEPDGLLAAGGDLSAERLLYAYRHGIFPWYDEGQPILWWSPNPRCILVPDEFHLARRSRRSLRTSGFEISFNCAFDEVVATSAAPRDGQAGTWITSAMKNAYGALHVDSYAHSVEVWQNEKLVGGLYGLAIGRVFFGESMFSRISNASKAAMFALCSELTDRHFELLDCQVVSPHLVTLGARLIARTEFSAILDKSCDSRARMRLPDGTRRPITNYLPE